MIKAQTAAALQVTATSHRGGKPLPWAGMRDPAGNQSSHPNALVARGGLPAITRQPRRGVIYQPRATPRGGLLLRNPALKGRDIPAQGNALGRLLLSIPALKGRDIPAQGNALGGLSLSIPALKGRDIPAQGNALGSLLLRVPQP
ncbi:hypothetical protein THSYN_11500 [Candidatus Thiodictyon syntrophicum]|uniref:Uncharacterized protein n=1 Tax=Candidatus Thiodictyon syntrophicum TaxID=1166950 RepID=A0A2K8U7J2_9GAMM|nr:hypothetical protein THSYN_11500 [Candidatus Thiodictyon syntrophicum]